jgi:hypothetical protein
MLPGLAVCDVPVVAALELPDAPNNKPASVRMVVAISTASENHRFVAHARSLRVLTTPVAPQERHRVFTLMQPPHSIGSSHSASEPQCFSMQQVGDFIVGFVSKSAGCSLTASPPQPGPPM